MVSLTKTARIVEWLPPYENDMPVCVWLLRVEPINRMAKIFAHHSGNGTMEANHYLWIYVDHISRPMECCHVVLPQQD